MAFTTNLTTAAMAIVALSSPALAPTATLTQVANPGDALLHVSDVRYFLRNCLVTFWDSPLTAEEQIAVASVTPGGQINSTVPVPGTITLDFTDMGYTGLKYAHGLNGTVATNITRAVPDQTTEMLGNRWPVWCFGSFDEVDAIADRRSGAPLGAWLPGAVLSLCYQLPAVPPESSGLHRQIYHDRQTQRAQSDIEQLVHALMKNSTLATTITDASAFARKFVRSLRLNTNLETPCWEGYLDIPVTSRFPVSAR